MSAIVRYPGSDLGESSSPRRSISNLLLPLEELANGSSSLIARPIGEFEQEGKSYEIPRYLFLGPNGGDGAIRIGIFGGLHGDELEGSQALAQLAQLLERCPEIANGYSIFLYPLCNPTGFEDNTPQTRSGSDLNQEFWRNSKRPEVQLLQKELLWQSFDGIVTLSSDASSTGFYGSARGALLTKHLLRPALTAAAELLPLNESRLSESSAPDVHDGWLSAPPTVRPKPFEISLVTPRQAPAFVQQRALVLALGEILSEHRKFIAYGANL